MGAPSATAGWYPDPSGKPMQRYFDGTEWTEHYAPATPQAAGVVTVGGTNHVVHGILTLLTCGLWLFVWLFIAASENKRTRAVDIYGNVIQEPARPLSPGEKPPTAIPTWVEQLPGNPWYWVIGLTTALVVGGLILTAMSQGT